MNLEQFQILITGIVDDQRHQESTAFIEELQSTQYPLYVQLLIETIAQYLQNNPLIAPVSCKLAITLALKEVQSKRIFQDQAFALQFLQTFSPMVTPILQSNIEDNFKKNTATILALLHVYIFQMNQNVSIPEYLLKEFNDIPDLRRYWIYCISEIAVNDPNFGGFSMEILLNILQAEGNEDLYSPKMHLFFSMATAHPDDQILHSMLPVFFQNCPPTQTEDLLGSLSTVAEISPSFIEGFVGQIVPLLCTIATNQENADTTRTKAMFCLVSISEGNPQLCQSLDAFYGTVFQALISVASEIDDDAPWTYDYNNISPYQTALDSLGYIFSSFDICTIYEPIHNLVIQHLQSDISWQQAYAVISSMAELNRIILSKLFESVDLQVGLFSSVAKFLTLETHPRVRCVVYNFIKKLSQKGILNPVFQSSAILINPLRSLMYNDDFSVEIVGINQEVSRFYIKTLAFDAFTQFISQLTGKKNIDYLVDLEPLKQELVNRPEFTVQVIRVIGELIKAAHEDGVQHIYPSVISLRELIVTKQDPNSQAEIIYCFSLVSSYFNRIRDDKIKAEIQAIALAFFQQAISLLDICTDETIIDHLYISISAIIARFGTPSEADAINLLGKMIADAQKDIAVQPTPIYETDSTYSNRSIYLKIPSIDPAVKLYVSTNEVKDVSQALLILNSLLYIIPIEVYIEEVRNIIDGWINNTYKIEPLQRGSWTLLETLVNRVSTDYCPAISQYIEKQGTLEFTEEQVQEISRKNLFCQNLFKYIFECYITTTAQKPSANFLASILAVIITILRLSEEIKFTDEETISKFLATIPPTLSTILQTSQETVQKMVEFQGLIDISNVTISHIHSCLSYISESILLCYLLNSDMAKSFYLQFFASNVDSYLSNKATLLFGLSIAAVGTIISEDKTKLFEILELYFKFANDLVNIDTSDDIQCDALKSIGKMLKYMPFNNTQAEVDACRFIIQQFTMYLERPEFQSIDNANIYDISDYAIIAVSQFLKANMNVIPHDEIADTLLFLPAMEDSPPDSHIFFDLLADLIADGSMMAADPEWSEHLLGGIISGLAKEQYDSEIEKKLGWAIYQRMATNPDEKNHIIATVSKLPEIRRNAFLNILLSFKKNNVKK